MAVYFVYRSHCNAPGEPFVWRFPFDTVLDWARAMRGSAHGCRLLAAGLIHAPDDAVPSFWEGEAPAEPRGRKARQEPRPPECDTCTGFVYEESIP